MAHKAEFEEKMDKTLGVLTQQLNTVRAGKANPSILDQISIDYYGTKTPLKNIANINVPDPRSLLISPFDPSVLTLIEKAIQVSDIGINPSNDGKNIRLVIPPLTEERRKELTKTIKKMGEDAKVAVRNLRRDANDAIKKLEKDGLATEDDTKRDLKIAQDLTDDCIKSIDDLVAKKDKELMEM